MLFFYEEKIIRTSIYAVLFFVFVFSNQKKISDLNCHK